MLGEPRGPGLPSLSEYEMERGSGQWFLISMFMAPEPTGGAEVTDAGKVAGVTDEAGTVAGLSVLPSADSDETPSGFGV